MEKYSLRGYVGKFGSSGTTEKGTDMTFLTVSFKDKKQNKVWRDVVCFGKVAKQAAKIPTGSLVEIHGRHQMFKDKPQVVAERIEFLASSKFKGKTPPKEEHPQDDADDSDLPF